MIEVGYKRNYSCMDSCLRNANISGKKRKMTCNKTTKMNYKTSAVISTNNTNNMKTTNTTNTTTPKCKSSPSKLEESASSLITLSSSTPFSLDDHYNHIEKKNNCEINKCPDFGSGLLHHLGYNHHQMISEHQKNAQCLEHEKQNHQKIDNKAKYNILTIPDSLLGMLLNFINIEDRLSLRAACRQLYRIISRRKELWQQLSEYDVTSMIWGFRTGRISSSDRLRKSDHHILHQKAKMEPVMRLIDTVVEHPLDVKCIEFPRFVTCVNLKAVKYLVKRFPNIQELNFKGCVQCRLSDASLKEIARLKHLKHFGLDATSMATSQGFMEIAEQCSDFTSFSSSFEFYSFGGMPNRLRMFLSSIRRIRLGNCFHDITEALKCSKLENISVFNCNVSMNDVLESSPDLKSVIMDSRAITDPIINAPYVRNLELDCTPSDDPGSLTLNVPNVNSLKVSNIFSIDKIIAPFLSSLNLSLVELKLIRPENELFAISIESSSLKSLVTSQKTHQLSLKCPRLELIKFDKTYRSCIRSVNIDHCLISKLCLSVNSLKCLRINAPEMIQFKLKLKGFPGSLMNVDVNAPNVKEMKLMAGGPLNEAEQNALLNLICFHGYFNRRLSKLEIRSGYCSFIEEQHIKMLTKKYPFLQFLSLHGCNILSKAFFDFSGLNYLRINGCTRLKEIHLNAPQLQHLKLEDCNSITTEAIKKVFGQCRNMVEFKMKRIPSTNCPRLHLGQIKHRNLEKVVLQGGVASYVSCPKIKELQMNV